VTARSFIWESTLPHSAPDVFAWHTRAGAFERLNPPWRPVSIASSDASIKDGATISLRLPLVGPIGIPWTLKHTDYRENEQFCDEQVSGPFRSWRHIHRFIPITDSSCIMRDEISYTLPTLSDLADPFIRAELTRLFSFRHKILASDLALHARFARASRKTVLITGSSGFIGSALSAFLQTAGHSAIRLVRRTAQGPHERTWNPARGELSPGVFDGVDAVIHLGGENLLAHRWNPEFKNLILKSRVQSTELLCSTIANLAHKPEVVITASATGFYGDTKTTRGDESSPKGVGFLAETCCAWETASTQALAGATRLVHLRIGTVLNPRGGALGKMLLPFTLGVGGPLGSGDQYISWISLQDLLGLLEYSLMTPTMEGACNATTPHPITNKEFAKALGAALHRPTILPIPAPVLKALLGEVADALLLSSSRVVSSVLEKRGYVFTNPTIESALTFELGLLS
jgi:uncharacterized protein (TIGR01777 family)